MGFIVGQVFLENKVKSPSRMLYQLKHGLPRSFCVPVYDRICYIAVQSHGGQVVHGEEYLVVLKYSATFAAEQLHSLSASLSKVLAALKRLAVEMARPGNRLTPVGIEAKIHRWLAAPFLAELVHYQFLDEPSGRRLVFQVDHAALQQLVTHRLGRTLLVTNRLDGTAEQVVAAYAGQQAIEQVFRGLKEGDGLNWQPLYHWTDSKIRVHAFYCLLGLSLLHYVRRQAQRFWPSITIEELQNELEQIQQFVLLYPAQGAGPYRTATVVSTQSLLSCKKAW